MVVMRAKPPIAILTDFGYRDPYVGIMKGVINKIAPSSQVIDLSHGIPPADIKQAAISLWQALPHFPAGTIFLTVVDPGVGTTRRAILLDNGRAYFVGPDNGLFTFIRGEKWTAWALENPQYWLSATSATFHGRDIFAPAAAHLALGTPPQSFGDPIEKLVKLPTPSLEFHPPNIIAGQILYADHFGNMLTSIGQFHSIGEDQLEFIPWLRNISTPSNILQIMIKKSNLVLSNGERIPLARTFAEIGSNRIAGIIGSSGLIEIAADRSRAENQHPALVPGASIRLEW